MSLFMFDVSWYDVWHHTKHIDPKATAMAESNSNVLYFVFHWHECDPYLDPEESPHDGWYIICFDVAWLRLLAEM